MKIIDYLSKEGLKHFFADLKNYFALKTEIPKKISDLENDSGFKTTDNNTTYTLAKTGTTITLTGSDGKTTSVEDSIGDSLSVDNVLSSTSENPVQNKVILTALEEKVPKTRTINNKALSANITLSASDVGADASGTAETKSNAVQANLDVVSDKLNNHVGNEDIHFTSEERTKLSGIATGANKYTHPSSGVTAGTYKSITVDANGHVTKGSNPTTLSGYGITDAEAKGTANTTVSNHNTSTTAHNDIRNLITELTNRLNTLADSDDTTLDQMSEIVAYIKSNKSLIDSVTTSKVNVSDIVNNLTTNVSNKPLSAAQGVAIKSLIDALQAELDGHEHDNYASTVTTTGSGNAVTSVTKNGSTVTVTKGTTFLTAHPTVTMGTNTTSTAGVTLGGTFTVIDSVTKDSNGHVTKINTKTITLPTDYDFGSID